MRFIIIGGTSGVGLATATLAKNPGHDVLAGGRDRAKFSAAEELGLKTAQLDAADAEAVKAFFATQGAFDHLITTVSGAAGAGAFRTLDFADLRTRFEGKFWPQLHCAQAALPTLSGAGGCDHRREKCACRQSDEHAVAQLKGQK